eukprot:4387242-Amphidinium_carterae.1
MCLALAAILWVIRRLISSPECSKIGASSTAEMAVKPVRDRTEFLSGQIPGKLQISSARHY